MESKILIRERDAAHLLDMSVAALRKWRREGRGPRYFKVGKLVRYRAGDIESFIAKHECKPSLESNTDTRPVR